MKEFMKEYPLLFYGLIVTALLVLLQIVQAVFAQTVDPLRPETWYVSLQTVMLVGAVLSGWIVKLLTALGKEALLTEGNRTRLLSAGISVVVAGVGGYLALGVFGGEPGFPNALRAAGMALWALLQANASAIYDRQLQDRAAAKSFLPGLPDIAEILLKEFIVPLLKDLLGSRFKELEERAYNLIDPIFQEMVAAAQAAGLSGVTYAFARPYLVRISRVLRDAGFSEVSP